MSKTRVTVQLTDVVVTVECPHEAVDTETIMEVVHTFINRGVLEIAPRWEHDNRENAPVFKAYAEVVDDPEIQDDDRSDDAPDEFDADCRWWQELAVDGGVK